jgi:NTP pyrophosphatase (non-canonical NTP hydrolase)
LSTIDIEFSQFTQALRKRTDEDFDCHDWSHNDWFTAMVGEVGELGNILKKIRRGDLNLEDWETRRAVGKELADIASYLFIHADKMDFNLAKECIEKYNEVSERRGSQHRIFFE